MKRTLTRKTPKSHKKHRKYTKKVYRGGNNSANSTEIYKTLQELAEKRDIEYIKQENEHIQELITNNMHIVNNAIEETINNTIKEVEHRKRNTSNNSKKSHFLEELRLLNAIRDDAKEGCIGTLQEIRRAIERIVEQSDAEKRFYRNIILPSQYNTLNTKVSQLHEHINLFYKHIKEYVTYVDTKKSIFNSFFGESKNKAPLIARSKNINLLLTIFA